MECKKCKAVLPEGKTVCPECGTDNAVKGIVLTPGKLTLMIGTVVVLTAVVVALIMSGMGYSFNRVEETAPATEAGDASVPASETVEATEATIPADGNPDDATCKGSYTVTDEEAAAAMDTVVATVGDAQLTNGQLQIYYWMEVQNFLSSGYSYYFGLDYTQPLDTQVCTMSETATTWQQYFLECALSTWHNYQALANESLTDGFQLDEIYRSYLDGIPESLATDAGLQGFATAEEYLAYNVGAGASVADYQHYLETYYQGYLYFENEYQTMIPTDEELEAYFTEHEAEYAESGVTTEGIYVDVRHVLIVPEGGTYDAATYTTTYTDEEWAAAEAKAQALLQQWLEGEATEEAFAELANTNSADSDGTDGGLYTNVYEGQMVPEFNDWCFDGARQVGDYGLVKTTYGWHIMYFSGSNPIWKVTAESDLLNERGMELIYSLTDKYAMNVDYSAVVLGFVDMTA